ncbi:MAG: sulfatase-like hydrolase/transferase [Fimbriimonadaceae bacterium]|nr:sulfatase-like hydrolase/transferase [Chitinophagales bacterium]
MKRLIFSSVVVLFSRVIMAQAPPKPNVLFIVVDDLNDYVEGFDGQPQIETPNFREVEERGYTFLNAFANAPGCAPSRTSMLSGKDLNYTKVYNNDDYGFSFRTEFNAASGNEVVYTLPEILKDSGGYFTYYINKIFHGVDEGDMDNSTSDQCEKGDSWNKQTVIEESNEFVMEALSYTHSPAFPWAKIPDSLEHYMQDVIGTDSAIQFINAYAAGTVNTCGNPFFLALGYHRPHSGRLIPEKYFPPYYSDDIYEFPLPLPYNNPVNIYPNNGVVMPPQPTMKWADFFALPPTGIARTIADAGTIEGDIMAYAIGLTPLPLIATGLTTTQRLEVVKEVERANHVISYMAAVQFIDTQLGRLLESLESHPDLLENTIIVLISDHGYSLGEKRHYSKWSLWETDLRIPFIIVDPKKSGNKISTKTVSLLDIFPTVLAMTGTSVPKFDDGSAYLDGSSLVPLINNINTQWEKPVLSTYKKNATSGSCFPHYSVRSEKFHYIRYQANNATGFPGGACDTLSHVYEKELYEIGVNRETDPYEWKNIASDPDYKPIINYLDNFFPDSIFYNKKVNKVVITNNATPCLLSGTAKIKLKAKLYTPEGALIAPGALSAYQFKWSTNLTAVTFTGVNYTFNMASLPAAIFSAEDKIILYLHVYSTLTGKLVAFDMKTYYINSLFLPMATYNTNLSGAQVSILDYNITGTYTNTKWDFGDGYQTEDFLPAPYSYSSIGTYTIKNTVQYGNGCSINFSKNINITELKEALTSSEEGYAYNLYPNPASYL